MPTALWTAEELTEEYRKYLEEQAKHYAPKYEWEIGGWHMFPNQVGGFRMVIHFDPNYTPRSQETFEVDPRPKPWKICYKSSWDATTYGLIGSFDKNSFETYEQAQAQFVETAQEIERRFKEAGITQYSVRQGRCSCGRVYDFDATKERCYPGMYTFTPYTQYDDVYDGCGGWD